MSSPALLEGEDRVCPPPFGALALKHGDGVQDDVLTDYAELMQIVSA
jgi:hypothetical protein